MQSAHTLNAGTYTDAERSTLGNLPAHIAAALCYFGPFGLIFFFTEKRSRLVRFHATQVLLYALAVIVLGLTFGIASTVVGFILGYVSPTLGVIAASIIWLAFLAFVVGAPLVGIIQALRGRMTKLPLIGSFAEKSANQLA